MFAKAYAGGYAVGAFNINNMEIIQAICEAAAEEKSPVILQVSAGARRYARHEYLVALARAAVKESGIDFALHLDHGADFDICKSCIDGGFTSVMIDGSKWSFDENIALTRKVVDYAHARGCVVEGELGKLAGIEDDVKVAAEDSSYTRPEEVEEFVTRTGVDSLAIAIGTSHGAFKFSGKQGLHFDVLEKIQKAVNEVKPNFPLVMHGSSSVPQEWVQRINNAGGAMKNASGVDEKQYLPAAKLGVTKINIDTDGRLVWCAIHREFFRDHPEKFDLREPGKVFMPAYAEYIIHKNQMLGSAGHLEEVRRVVAK